MKKILLLSTAAIISFLPFQSAYAKAFNVTLSSNGDTRNFSFDNVEEAVDTLSGSSLEELLPNYTTGSAATASVNLRGLGVNLSYAAGSNTLVLNIPSIDETRTFTGANRDESQELLEDFFRGDGGDDLLTDILQELASETPIDPVAGNPNALLSRMGDADFERGTNFREGVALSANDGGSNLFGTTFEAGQFNTDVTDQTVLSAGVTYSRLASGGDFAVLFDVPFTYIESEGSQAYQVSVGGGVRVPLTEDWALTPMLRVGASGSEDLGSAAVIYSGTVTSDYRIPLSPFDQIQIGNMIGYYKTDGITVGDYRIDYDLSNTRLKNGVAYSHQFVDSPLPWTGRVFANDSRFFGDDLFNDNYQEFGGSIGKELGGLASFDFGGSYLYAEDYDGVRLTLNFKF